MPAEVVPVTVVDSSKPIGDAAVVVGAFADPAGVRLARGVEQLEPAIARQLAAAYRHAGGTGALDEVIKIPTLGLAKYPLIVVTGLGRPGATGAAPADERVKRAIAAALRAVTGQSTVRICLSDAALDAPAFVGAAAFGAALGGYRFGRYKAAAPPARAKRIVITSDGPRAATSRAIRRALALAEAITFARDLVNTPPNDMYPESFAAEVGDRASDAGLGVEVLTERQLARQGFGGLLAVGRGSAHRPRLLRLTYRPPHPRCSVALVGEGTTFNSGGLNLKTAQMSASKADMAGAAAVSAVLLAAARLTLPVALTATVPLAENLPSAESFRPSDIVVMHGGRTVEVTDTEAGGRLIVAEAIGRAVADQPDYLLETSTLTSAQRIALGQRLIAVMGSPAFRDRVVAAGSSQGEASWAMPLTPELRAGLDSSAADLGATAPDRWGAMLSGGAFLADFVPAGLEWAHLDIAGPAWNTGAAHGYTPKGGTGAGVVTLFATIESIAAGTA
jgi:leucyl aminopeptidase